MGKSDIIRIVKKKTHGVSEMDSVEWPAMYGRLRLKCDGTRAETRFRLSTKRTSPFKSAGVSVQWTTSSRGVRISGTNAVYTVFRGSVKGTGYPLHSPVPPLLTLPCVTVCHHVSTGLYNSPLTLRRLMSYIYIEHPFLMFLDHTQRRSTVGRTPLDE